MLLNADVRQNFTSEELNLEKKKKQTKHETKVYANPGLS